MDGSLICPLCGSATALMPVAIHDMRAYLPRNSGENNQMYGEAVCSAIITTNFKDYAVFNCCSCKKPFVGTKEAGQYVVVWPLPNTEVEQEIPDAIQKQFREAKQCYAIGAYLGSVLVCRTALISMQRDKKVQNIKELNENGAISTILYRQADEVRLWANLFAHQDIQEQITKEDSEQLIAYIDILFHAVYTEPTRLEKLRQRRKEIENKKE